MASQLIKFKVGAMQEDVEIYSVVTLDFKFFDHDLIK